MYSLVLMAAMTTGGSTPDCHWVGSGHGGCYGGCYGGYGGCYGGCYGGYGGCYGGCYGGWGNGHATGYGAYGCYGCSGAWTGWWTTYSCYGCYGCHGCYGCYGCYGCTGYGSLIGPAGPTMPGTGNGASNGGDKGTGDKKGDKNENKNGGETSAKARLIVDLPADAKLYIDDHKMKATSSRRAFSTPNHQAGQTYYYILRAEMVREGKTVSETKRVLVRAGQEVRANFDEPPTAVAKKKRTR
jgi:uncharacterized protein (TIGR03000 family)